MIKLHEDLEWVYNYYLDEIVKRFQRYQFQMYTTRNMANIEEEIAYLRKGIQIKYNRRLPLNFYKYEFDEETSSLNLDFISLDEFKNWYIKG